MLDDSIIKIQPISFPVDYLRSVLVLVKTGNAGQILKNSLTHKMGNPISLKNPENSNQIK